MMRWIVGSSLKFRFLVIAIAVGMMCFGIEQTRKMAVDVFPEFAPPLVEIQTPSLGLSPAEVEALVTIPLEEVLAGVPGLDVMRSKSVPQLSSIKMIFEPGTDLLLARQMVQERVALVTLPTWASGESATSWPASLSVGPGVVFPPLPTVQSRRVPLLREAASRRDFPDRSRD